jgi:hypothetical protein
MAAVGLGVGGEGAIVIDDNCTVSMVLEHRWLRNCHSKLLTREPRSCELGLSSDDCSTHQNDISNERDWTGSWRQLRWESGRSRPPKPNVKIVVSPRRAVRVYGEFGLQTKPETPLFL